ncbi:MAG: hypothetical protein AB8B94_19715, partial [Hyphomicrobiales bacterium]
IELQRSRLVNATYSGMRLIFGKIVATKILKNCFKQVFGFVSWSDLSPFLQNVLATPKSLMPHLTILPIVLKGSVAERGGILR